ncbi:MAG: cupin [Pseudorhodobacter sp. PARRP1]|nr:MAG: cupin [Pseudorhodobacter sp. PARRP1]
MIDLSAFYALAQTPLEAFAPKPTSFEGDQQEASVALFTSADGRVEIGVWECTPGRFTADRSAASEFCHFITGRIEMTHADGRKVQLGAGDAIALPLGWKGEWRVIEQVRKLYVIMQA